MEMLNTRYRSPPRSLRSRRREKKFDWRFWAETAALSLFFGATIAVAIRLTGRELEVVLVALAAGLIKIASVVARQQAGP